MTRPTRDETLLAVLEAYELRSTCSRNAVAALIVRSGRILSTGYNGAPAKLDHCNHDCDCGAWTDTGREDGTPHSVSCPAHPHVACTVAVHAEVNAIAYAARSGVVTEGADMVCSLTPCVPCAQLIINSGIARVLVSRDYRDPRGSELLLAAGVRLCRLTK